jgi:hypothetical protein
MLIGDPNLILIHPKIRFNSIIVLTSQRSNFICWFNWDLSKIIDWANVDLRKEKRKGIRCLLILKDFTFSMFHSNYSKSIAFTIEDMRNRMEYGYYWRWIKFWFSLRSISIPIFPSSNSSSPQWKHSRLNNWYNTDKDTFDYLKFTEHQLDELVLTQSIFL